MLLKKAKILYTPRIFATKLESKYVEAKKILHEHVFISKSFLKYSPWYPLLQTQLCVRSTLVQKALNSQIQRDTRPSISEMNIAGFFIGNN